MNCPWLSPSHFATLDGSCPGEAKVTRRAEWRMKTVPVPADPAPCRGWGHLGRRGHQMPPPLETFPDHRPHSISNGLWVARHLSTPPLPCVARLEAMRKSHVRLLKQSLWRTVKKAVPVTVSDPSRPPGSPETLHRPAHTRSPIDL